MNFAHYPVSTKHTPDTLPHEEVAEFLARRKASACLPELRDDELIITADTVVLLNGMILGKPADKEDAKRMLRLLSGETHRVVTGVCLTSAVKQVAFSDVAHVTFGGVLSDEEIDYYVSAYNPMDKAGAYGVQEWIGYIAVERIQGSYFNVMGLPVLRFTGSLRTSERMLGDRKYKVETNI